MVYKKLYNRTMWSRSHVHMLACTRAHWAIFNTYCKCRCEITNKIRNIFCKSFTMLCCQLKYQLALANSSVLDIRIKLSSLLSAITH